MQSSFLVCVFPGHVLLFEKTPFYLVAGNSGEVILSPSWSVSGLSVLGDFHRIQRIQ